MIEIKEKKTFIFQINLILRGINLNYYNVRTRGCLIIVEPCKISKTNNSTPIKIENNVIEHWNKDQIEGLDLYKYFLNFIN